MVNKKPMVVRPTYHSFEEEAYPGEFDGTTWHIEGELSTEYLAGETDMHRLNNKIEAVFSTELLMEGPEASANYVAALREEIERVVPLPPLSPVQRKLLALAMLTADGPGLLVGNGRLVSWLTQDNGPAWVSGIPTAPDYRNPAVPGPGDPF